MSIRNHVGEEILRKKKPFTDEKSEIKNRVSKPIKQDSGNKFNKT